MSAGFALLAACALCGVIGYAVGFADRGWLERNRKQEERWQ